ncbi:MAG TPA: DUF2087 domain-containing protein [Acidimicrobiales bacterium]|nr:DUF2087 domain-containing protein [Acidimicrobiales bacterium]
MDTKERADRMPHRAPAPEEVVGLLADDVRLRLIACLVEGSKSLSEMIAAGERPAREVIEQLQRLERAEVVDEDDGRYSLRSEVFARSVREAAASRLGPLNDEHTQIARRYFFRNRLTQIPSEPWALEVVLRLVAEDFQPGETYDEREVNSTLYGWNGDWAALRRMLVDRGHLRRAGGKYWRGQPS